MEDSEIRRQCAQLFMVGFDGFAANKEIDELIRAGIFGVILFKRNIASFEQVQSLIGQLKKMSKGPLILAVDQEGGRVARLRESPFSSIVPMRVVGTKNDVLSTYNVGKLLAYELRAVGFDWDFAPVVDVDTNPKNPVIGDRSFSRDAALVAQMAVALARGLEEGGVASCAKHFPGHGDTTQDSHVDLPRLKHDLQRLRQVELVPFAAYADANLASVMTAHVIFEAIDSSVPATMSAQVLDGILRKELKFDGVVVSDDLEMKAIADHYSIEEAVLKGFHAGVDLFLVCHHAEIQNRAIDALANEVRTSKVAEGRLQQSLKRLNRLSKKFAHGAADVGDSLGKGGHAALIRQLGELVAGGSVGVDPTERS